MKTTKNTFENYPDWLIIKWQEIADLLVELLNIPAALLMKTENEFMEVFISSKSENNPYQAGDKEKCDGLYSEKVIKSQNKLSISNAAKDKNWNINPDIQPGMIAYLGYPINFPDNQPFGTLCVLDTKERQFTLNEEKLLLQFKNVIELDLALIQTYDNKTNELAKTIIERQSQISNKNIELQITKEKAEENKDRYKMMLNAAMFPIVISTFKGKVVFINQAAADFFGVSFDEIDQLSSVDFWATPSQRKEFVSQLKENGVVNSIEIEYKTKKNGIRHTVMSSTIIDYYDSKAILSILNDVTSQRLAEKALLKSNQLLKSTFFSLRDAVFILDAKTAEITDCNPAATTIFGYSHGEMIGKTTELLHIDVEALQRFRNYLYPSITEKGFLFLPEFEMKRKNGTFFPTENTVLPLDDNNKERIGWVSVVRDITERKKAEEVLSQSEARLNALLSSMKDIIFEINLNGCFEGYYAKDIKGFYAQPVLFIGKKIDEVLPNHISKLLNGAIENIYEGKQFEQFEYSITIGNNFQHESAIVTPRFNKSNEIIGTTVVCRDITERKLAEENLNEIQRKLANLMGNLPGLAFRCMNNRDWTMLFMSEGCFELTEFYPQELIGNQLNSYGKLIHQDDVEMVWQNVQIAVNNHTVWQIEYRIHTKDGIEKWVWERGSGVYSNTGELEVLEGFISDITIRKQAEKALQKSESRYAFMAKNTIDVIWTLSLSNGKFTYVSPSVQKLRGYTPDEVMNQTMAEALTPESLQKVTALIHERLTKRKSGDKSSSTNIYLADQPCKDGSVVSTEVVGNIVFDKDGAPVEVIGVSRDITERKKAEKQLQESEEKYRYIVDNAPIGVFQRSIQGSFNFCNLTLAKQFECNSIDEFLLNYNDVSKRWASYEQFIEFNELLLKNGEVLGFENKVKLINGKTKWFSLYYKLDSAKSILDGFSLDITEQKKAEQAIIESNDYNRQLFSKSQIGLVLAKMTGELVDINQAYADIIGYTIEETLQLTYWDITPEKYAEKEQEQLKCLDEKGLYGPYEKEYIHKNGALVPVVLSGKIIERYGEKFIWSSVGDITERKKNEAVLTKLYTAINSSKASIVITDIDGNIEFANPYFSQLTGYSKNEYLGKNPKVLKSGIHTDEYYKIIWDTINSGNTWEGEFCNRKKNGELYWEKSIITPIKNEKEEIINFVAVKSDITNEKKHEYLIDISLEIYEKSECLTIEEILKLSIELGIQLTDSEIGFFHFVNPDQETISLQAWSAKTMDMCNVPKLDKHYPISKAGVWVDCFHQKKPVFHNDYSSLLHKKGLPEGHATLTRDLSVPVIIENQVVAIFGVGNKESDYTKIDTEFLSVFAENVWNVVRRKKSETDTIKAKEKAEEGERLKSAFLANMSHEIRTPMNGILGFSALLSEPGLESEEQQEYIKIIQKSGARMLNIISEIMDISKIESGLVEIRIKEVNITKQVESVYELLKPDADVKAINLFIKNSMPMNNAIFMTDGEKLFGILSNLIKNAIKYTDKGSVEFGYLFSNSPTELNELQFYVKDTGIGIPKDRQQAIFDRFIQADIADIEARQGAGLGLSIVKAYVEMLGGKIWVESEQGIGSCFYFTLPINTEPEEKNVAAKVVLKENLENNIHPEVLALKILIAEDDEVSKTLFYKNVKPFSKQIIVTTTGVETIETCRINPDIDLILMDIRMPNLNGYEATRQIRQFNKDVVIVAQTSFGLSGDKEKAIEAGCNDYITKPINKDELHSLIQKYFKGQRLD
ncbi:MAG: PAS domain S-box protein [Bacteroidota bacterium]